MKTKIFLWLLFVCMLSPLLSAQHDQKLDSLLNEYVTNKNDSIQNATIFALFNYYRYNDSKKSKNYAFELLSLSKKMENPELISRSYLAVNNYYYSKGDIDSSYFYVNKAMAEFKNYQNPKLKSKIKHANALLEYNKGNWEKALDLLDENIDFNTNIAKDSFSLGNTYSAKGLINKGKGDYKIAIEEILKAIKIYKDIDEPEEVAYNMHLLGDTESRLGNFNKSIEYHLEGLQIFESSKEDLWVSTVLMCLGNENLGLEDYKNAEEYYLKSLSISKKLNDFYGQQVTINNLSKVYLLLGKYDEALSFAKESAKLVEYTKDEAKILENQIAIGNIYQFSGKSRKAIEYFDKVIPIADSLGIKLLLSDAYLYRSDTYLDLRDYQMAMEDYKRHITVKDSIFNAEKSQQIEELRTIYETEKKEQQIALQEKEITVLEQKAEISTLQKIVLGIGLLLSLIGFYAVRQKMKRNKVEKEKVDAELEFKKKELTTHALNLARKNETLENLKTKALELRKSENSGTGYNQLIRTINFDLQDDNNWGNFSRYFEEVHKDFNSSIKQKYPDVTSNELRLLALLKMNLSSKEIANILNISPEGIKKARYRLRKKLNITTEDSLQDLVLAL